MTLETGTALVHMINIAITAADGSGRMWQEPTQMIPLGMNGNPEAFVTSIKAGLPLVNNLRIQFNEYSFNADGSMNPQFERFLAAAASQGYKITLTYSSGDTQNIGIGDAAHPHLTNAQAYDALEANFTKVKGAWSDMMDWMDGHPTVERAAYGWDLMNEAAAYRHSAQANKGETGVTTSEFVALYAEHCGELAQLIEARADGRILVGGWGYNTDFETLAVTKIAGISALDYIRDAVGDSLVWSAHLYPGWMGTNSALSPGDLVNKLDAIYGSLGDDDLLMTETNIDGSVDDTNRPDDYSDLFAAIPDWFAEHGVGIGWFPGAQTGASHLIYVEKNGDITFRHQHSLAHALDTYSLPETPFEHSGGEKVTVTLVEARLRNEPYEIAAGEGQWDPMTKMGTAFGFGGADILVGTLVSNDFMYGGGGNDTLRATGGDDFLFGQGDNDLLLGGTGYDQLFGGLGNDTLDAGTGNDMMAGGAGDDTYIIRDVKDVLKEFANSGTDLVQTTLHYLSLGKGTYSQFTNIENLTFVGNGTFRGIGNALNNIVTGGNGADGLSGATGDDTMVGRQGDDQLWGGPGADHFVFTKDTGHDQVMDFSDEDYLVFQNFSVVSTVADAMSHARQIGADVVFDFGADGGLIVLGVSLGSLSDDILVN